MDEVQLKKSKRGFASMSPEVRREIASKGGRSVPAEKRSYSKNPELAAAAGHKGGKSVPPPSAPSRRTGSSRLKQAQRAVLHPTPGGRRRRAPDRFGVA